MKFRNNNIAFLLFIVFSAIYYLGSFSRVPFGDCMGFVLDTEKNDFILKTTSTAHFLYINTSIFINKIFNFGGIETTKFLSVFSGAMVVAIVFLIVFELTSNRWASISGAVLFGFSFSFWRNAGIPEVYAYNTVFVSLYLLFATKLLHKKEIKYLIFSGIFLGISLWEHIQNILLIPAFFYLIFIFRKEKKSWIALLVFVFIFAGLFVQPIMDGVSTKFVFKSGTWIEKSVDQKFSDYLKEIVKAMGYLIYNFWHFIILGLFGIKVLFKENFKIFLFLAASSLPIIGFATFYAVSDNYVFFISFNLIFAVISAIGLTYFVDKKYFKTLSLSVFAIPLFYFLTFNIAANISSGKKFDASKKYKGGLNYYLLPWINNNKGIIEFYLNKTEAPDETYWMTESAKEYVKLMQSKGYTLEEIKKM